MKRIEEEKTTIGNMVHIYCKANHNGALCDECKSLLEYAHKRLETCKFGDNKPNCKKCAIHCYQPIMRDRIQQVMRYAGPRMIWHHPIAAIRYLWREINNH